MNLLQAILLLSFFLGFQFVTQFVKAQLFQYVKYRFPLTV